MHCCLFERHDELERQLKHQHDLLMIMGKGIIHMSASLDRLTTELSDTKAAVASIIDLVKSLQSATPPDESAAIDALSNEVVGMRADILAAINPPAPTPPVISADDTAAAVGQNS